MIIKISIIKLKIYIICIIFIVEITKHTSKIIRFLSGIVYILYLSYNPVYILYLHFFKNLMKIYLSFIRFHFCVIIFLLRSDTRGRTVNYANNFQE